MTLEPKRFGDGHEYFLQLWALSSHLSPEIRPSDVENLSKYIQERKLLAFPDSFLPALKEEIESGSERAGRSSGRSGDYLLYRNVSGSYYSLHFWFYSAMSVPAKWVLHMFGKNELKAFQVTNAILLVVGFAYLFFLCSLATELRIAVAVLLYGIGAPYYLRWPHPEIFSIVACVIASTAFLERRLTVATLACALGALQNPSMALMIPVVFASDLDQWFKLPISGKRILLSKLFMVGSLSFLPFAFYLVKFGTPSLIAKRYLDLSYVDLDRLYSLVFDLNQGMVVGAGWIIALSGMILISRFSSIFRIAGPNIKAQCLRREDWLLGGMLLMAIGVLPQTNWNSDQAVYSRYAIWLIMPLMLWVVCQIPAIKLGRFSLVIVIAAQLFTMYLYGSFSRSDEESNYLSHKRIAVAALRYVPWAYNPEPEIFVERTLQREVGIEQWRESVIFIPYKGSPITKILVHKTRLDTLSSEICGNNHELMTEGGGRLQPKMYKSTRLDFIYLSGSFLCIPQPTFKHNGRVGTGNLEEPV